VLPDSAIIDAVLTAPTSESQLASLPVFRGRATRRYAATWYAALAAASALPEDGLPTNNPPSDGPPPAHRWAERDPIAAARLAAARAAVTAVSVEHNVPAQNLLAPEVVRRLAWTPPTPLSSDGVAQALHEVGARPWQIELTAAALTDALAG
jgi:ribonuclease D